MRPKIASIFAFAAFSLLTAATVVGETRLDQATKLARAYAERVALPGFSIVIADASGTVWSAAWGVSDLSTGKPMLPSTPVPIGSLTKSFTALLVMRLAEEGRLDIDSPVTRYLPWFTLADQGTSDRITLRNLLNNASGIPAVDGWQRYSGRQSEDLMERDMRSLAVVKSRGTPGVSFAYANENWTLLGLAAMAATGKPFGVLMEEYILGPLGMLSSTTDLERIDRLNPAIGSWYDVSPSGEFRFIPAEGGMRAAAMPAGSCMVATADDMGSYMGCLLSGGSWRGQRLVGKESLAELWKPAVRFPGIPAEFRGTERDFRYAMGWIVAEVDGRDLVFHGGNTLKASAMMALDPEAGFGICMLANASEEMNPFRNKQYLVLINDMLHALRGESLTDWGTPFKPDPATLDTRIPQDREWLSMLQGKWKGNANQTLDIGPGDGETWLRVVRRDSIARVGFRMEFAGKGRFFLENGSGTARGTVRVDAAGRPARLVCPFGEFVPARPPSPSIRADADGYGIRLPAGWTEFPGGDGAAAPDGKSTLHWGFLRYQENAAREVMPAALAARGVGNGDILVSGRPRRTTVGTVAWETAAFALKGTPSSTLLACWTDTGPDGAFWLALEAPPELASAGARTVLAPLMEGFAKEGADD